MLGEVTLFWLDNRFKKIVLENTAPETWSS